MSMIIFLDQGKVRDFSTSSFVATLFQFAIRHLYLLVWLAYSIFKYEHLHEKLGKPTLKTHQTLSEFVSILYITQAPYRLQTTIRFSLIFYHVSFRVPLFKFRALIG